MVQVAVPLSAADVPALLSAAQRAEAEGADLVELRLDVCAKLGAPLRDVIAAIPRFGLPVIVTIRHGSEGGEWRGSDTERAALYREAVTRGAAWCDIELAQWAALHTAGLDRRLGDAQTRLILSHHDFTGPGGDLAAIVTAMHAAGAAIAKVAVTARDAGDLAIIEALCRQTATGPVAAMAMGEHGLPSRLLAGAWGSALTFARLDGDPGTAPGQPSLRELLGLYRLRSQGADTRIFGVIGKPVGHSLSPLIHNRAFAHHRLDAVYVPFLVDDVVAFWRDCGGWIDGLSITIPHKEALLDEVDVLEPLAERIGAINTIWRDDLGRAIGANTDAHAAAACIEQQVGTLKDRRVLLLGAGGVGRAIAFSLHERGARVTIANRTLPRAEALARDVGCAAVDPAGALAQTFDVLVNGTNVGMRDPGSSPWPSSAHRAHTVVFDTVYTPLETRLLRDAQAGGATTICGLSMFIGQALGQYRRWTGLEAPDALMYRTALERLGGDTARLAAPAGAG